MVNVEIVYAKPNQQVIIPLQVSTNTTIEQAIHQSGILKRFPEINLTTVKVGIFSKVATLNQLVNDGDRIEIYRPLTIDPKQARLLRAKHKK